MAAARVDIIIGADGKEVTQTLGELKKQFRDLGKSLDVTQPGAGVALLNKQLSDTKANMAAINKFNIGGQLSSIKPGANQAGAAMIALNRVMQDAPFGFIAIQNNITELPQVFRSLVQATGSTSGALKALGSSLLGAGGIGFAISAITSLTTVAIQKYGSLGNAVGALLGSLTPAAIAQQKYTEALTEANKSAGEQIAKVKLLASAASDTTRDITERKNATRQLQDLLKEYNVSLTTEAALNGKVAEATQKAEQAIISRAKATAVSDRLAKVEAGLLEITIKRESELNGLNNAYAEFNKQNAIASDSKKLGAAIGNADKLGLATIAIEARKAALIDLGNEEANYLSERKLLLGQFKENDFKIDLDLGKIKEVKSALQTQIEQLEALKKQVGLSLSQEELLIDLKAKFFIDQNKWLSDLQKTAVLQYARMQKDDLISFDLPVKINLLQTRESVARVIETLDAAKDNLSQAISRMYNALSKQGQIDGEKARKAALQPLENLNSAIRSAISGGLSGIGEAIGDSLAGAASPAEAFINVISQALAQLGQALIAYGVAMKIAETALASAFKNPAVAIAAGIGAIAAGKLLKAQIAKPKKFAEGGIVTAPTMGLVGEAGPEAIIPLNRADDFFGNNNSFDGRVEFEIAGEKLVGVLVRAQNKNRRVG